MNRTVKTASLIAFLVLAVFGGLAALKHHLFPSSTVRYRVTVVVETPQGLRSGSSVVELRIERGLRWGEAKGTYFRLKGEAAVVDLGNGNLIFALLRGEDIEDPTAYYAGLMKRAFRNGARGNITPPPALLKGPANELYAWARSNHLQFDLPQQDWPMLVRFRDISESESVEQVNLQLVKVNRVNLEVTNANITSDIIKKLHWLSDEGLSLDSYIGPATEPNFAQTLRQRVFSTEVHP